MMVESRETVNLIHQKRWWFESTLPQSNPHIELNMIKLTDYIGSDATSINSYRFTIS